MESQTHIITVILKHCTTAKIAEPFSLDLISLSSKGPQTDWRTPGIAEQQVELMPIQFKAVP